MAAKKKKSVAPRREYRTAIIDIGSNSIRLVVYAGPRRNPAITFNEKVMAGLGSELSATGKIGEKSMQRGLAALERFKSLIDLVGADEVICVATAAVRDATNGFEFAGMARKIGFDIEILSGLEEAETAAMGVLSGIPGSKGIVGDLGGGSLELARIGGGKVHERVSMPIGVLRAAPLRKEGKLEGHVKELLSGLDPAFSKSKGSFYLVGGSWRALARLDMHLQSYPLKVLHNYTISRKRAGELINIATRMSDEELLAIDGFPFSRVTTLRDAAALLDIIDSFTKPREYVVSAYGLREGLLYGKMSKETRKRDPLLEPAARFGRLQSRYGRTGERLYEWLTPLFKEKGRENQRLLLASCHLADVGWQANPNFRSARGIDMALHGNWVGIDARGRMLVAQALSTSFDGGVRIFMENSGLLSDEDMRRAICWGLAIRLAKRLSGGTDKFLTHCSIRVKQDRLQLLLQPEHAHFYGEVVERRHQKLAREMQLEAELVLSKKAAG
ncbi:Ppx/GppA family phosphatase [Sphingorhabdus sp. Alg239-R122]|uniref:Ppx/GppA family phosphatase n=1 Tax=Sphingorhabdus sp. Alg239-R122 TaxID=2305989 RepID=UPI0013D98BA4|nr:Ppx/GppA family phosphatase [Sphingorhabdus sp. Alg239-R122]